MKKFKKLLIISLIFTIFMTHINLNCNIKIASATSSASEIVIERNSLKILHEYNSEKISSIASLTKIITCITAIENCKNLNEKILITDKMCGIEGSSIYLRAGEKITILELLYGLMLRSGNDAATAIALSVGGSIENFASLMNKTALKAGAKNSSFKNPHGLEQEGHYSTAKDLALICCYALNNPIFAKIVSTKKKVISNSLEEYDRVLINKNKILSMLEGSDGIKTGYTKVSGRCLASSATRNGIQLVCIVLNCGPMFERSCELINNCFKNYSLLD